MMPAKDTNIRHASIKPSKVLVVDDEEYVRTILKGMLENMGFEILEASDGDQGLQAFDNCRQDIVACIIDLSMPGMTGMELLGNIRDQDIDVPIILVSGYSPHEVRQQEAKSPNLSFLQKPFTMEQFEAALTARLKLAVG